MGKTRSTSKTPLEKAFMALNKQRILTSHAFGCCEECSSLELRKYVGEGRGIAFYTGPDCEEAIESGKLKVRFEAVDGVHLAVASRCIVALEKAGLHTKWNADCGHPILVSLSPSDKALMNSFAEKRCDRLLTATGEEHKLRDCFRAWRQAVAEEKHRFK